MGAVGRWGGGGGWFCEGGGGKRIAGLDYRKFMVFTGYSFEFEF